MKVFWLAAVGIVLCVPDAGYSRDDAPPGGSILDKRAYPSAPRAEENTEPEIIPIPAEETPWTTKPRRKRPLPAFDPWGGRDADEAEPTQVTPDTQDAVGEQPDSIRSDTLKRFKPLKVAEPQKVATLVFERDQQRIDSGHKELLQQHFDTNRKTGRFILKSYAQSRGDFPGEDRRIALKRALEVRSYLIELGYGQNDITIRALGDSDNTAPEKERVEIYTSI